MTSASASSSARLWRASSSYGSWATTLHAEALEPPPQGPADGAQPDQAGRLPGHLATPGTAGRGSCRRETPGRPGHPRRRPAGGGWRRTAGRPPSRRRRRRCGRVCAARDPRRGGARTSTLFGSPRVEAMARSGKSNTGPLTESFRRQGHRPSLCDALGQLLGGVDPQRCVLDPRVVDHVGQLRSLSKPSPRNGAVTRARSRVTMPMLAYGDARVTQRGHNRHRHRHDLGQGGGRRRGRPGRGHGHGSAPARVPAPDRLEHDADEAWRQGPLAALAELAAPTPRGGRHGDGAVADRRRHPRQAAHARAALRRRPRSGSDAGPGTSS